MQPRLAWCWLVGAIAAASSSLAGQAAISAPDLAAKVQARYSTVRDFTADFTQTQTSGLTRQSKVDQGKVSVKKPGRMRWVSTTGSKSEVVADGAEMYFYLPKDRLVQITTMPKDGQASTALLLLTGRGDLTKDFTPSPSVESTPTEWHLALTPKTPQADFKTLTLTVDRTSLQLHGLTILDTQGGIQRFQLTNLRENRGIPDSVFEFKIPKGVDVRR